MSKTASLAKRKRSLPHKFEAVRHAHAFAAHRGASVWFIEPGGSHTRVEKPRAKES